MNLISWLFCKVTYTCTLCEAVQTIPVRRIHLFERFHGLDEGQPVLIRCPQCGRGYIGTAATGRSKTYRYYTCWSRARYGNKAGCDIHRFNADDTALFAADRSWNPRSRAIAS